MTAPVRFTFSPDPPKAGKPLHVTYLGDLDPEVTWPVVVEIQMTPTTGSKSFTLTAANPSCDIDVPSGAVGVTAHDQSGQSQDYSKATV